MKNNLFYKEFASFKTAKFLVVLLFFGFSVLSFGQKTISGTVKGSDNSPLPGVNVSIVGTSNGTLTDFDGKYTIKAKKGETLRFSYIGMLTQNSVVGDSNIINLSMKEGGETLDEVVIVGYGTQRKSDVTGAVSTVKANEIVSIPTTNAVEALQGKASGVTLINNGSPGHDPTVRIRGLATYNNNDPIYVVDGVIVRNIDGLSANDIASFSVLKDASTTAVYGSLGANGVIEIKTKSGKVGKTKFSFNSYFNSKFKPSTLQLLNSDQYVSYVSDMIHNQDPAAALPPRFTDSQYADMLSQTVNYQDAIFQRGFINNYELSASGGVENAKFRFSGNYQKQEGTMINTALDRYVFRLNSKFKKGIFHLGENVSVAYAEQDPLILAFSVSPLENAIKMAPYLPINNADFIGGYNELDNTLDANDTRNPLRTLNRETQLNKNINILGNVFGKVDITKDLQYKSSIGMNFYDNKFKKAELPYGSGSVLQTDSRYTYVNVRVKTISFINSLNYKKTIADKHNFNVLLLAEQRKRSTNIFSGQGTTPYGVSDLSSGLTAGAKSIQYNTLGYLGRINYNYDRKYLFAASLRRDSSSRFGENKRSGTFPSLALGWVVSKENFFKDNNFINYLKIRGSWGIAGNDQGATDYAFESSLSPNYIYNGTAGLAIGNISNPNLKWEETVATNIGLDFRLLKNKINFSVEYYKNTSSDLIVMVNPAASVGAPNPTPTNVGGVISNGVEFNLGYDSKSTSDFNWSTNFNLSTNRNEVTKVYEDAIYQGSKPNVLGGGEISRLVEGEPIWHFYGYETDGIFQNQAEIDEHATQPGAAPGDIRFKDLNDDGVINADDRTNIGNPFPKISYGLNLNADYKNLDFNMFFNGVSGNKIFNALRYYLDGASQITNTGTAVLDRWTPTNHSNSQPRAVLGDPNGNTRVSDRYIEDGSFVRLKNISLGYKLPSRVLDKIGKGSISKFRVYMSAQNLLTFTKYTGYDPEIGPSDGISSTNGNHNSELGVDRGQYPQSKSVLLGVQINF